MRNSATHPLCRVARCTHTRSVHRDNSSGRKVAAEVDRRQAQPPHAGPNTPPSVTDAARHNSRRLSTPFGKHALFHKPKSLNQGFSHLAKAVTECLHTSRIETGYRSTKC